MKNRLIIIGASGHGKVIANIAKLNGYKEIAFLDDDTSKRNNEIYTVLGTSKEIGKFIDDNTDFIVGIGNNTVRKKISTFMEELDIIQPVLIHPTAVIDESVTIGEGTVVMANVVVNAYAKIGKYCILNTSATIDHDCVLGDYVHISPGVNVAGTVNIGNNCWICIGCAIANNLSICNDVIIGAGTTIIRNIEEPGKYVGIPLRRLD